jgi:hypothetical protein
MSPDQRGSTHRGQHAPVAAKNYELVRMGGKPQDDLVIEFAGEDGRNAVFSAAQLPLLQWHPVLAETFRRRVGPAGTRRTLASARSLWTTLGRFMRYLASLPAPPVTPQQLTPIHVDAYVRSRIRALGGMWGFSDFMELRPLLQESPLRDALDASVHNYLDHRRPRVRPPSLAGYSDGEFARLVDAARTDVADIRARIDASERLLAAWTAEPTALGQFKADRAAELSTIAATGVVPRLNGVKTPERVRLAQKLFITASDREALLLLLVAVTGRNPEVLKELPHEHRVIEGQAVEVQVIKRRRGPQRWHDTMTWEIGSPHRELHTPGGLYLLLHRLMARGRGFSESESIWSTWRCAQATVGIGVGEHRDPYAAALAGSLRFQAWAQKHDLFEDSAGEEARRPLPIDLRRVRTSVEVRRTRALGGHLPSAARSHTTDVLFESYLRGDPTTREWAEEVVSQAMSDAETSALAAHRRTLAANGGGTHLRIDATAPPEQAQHEGAWNACTDPESHPATGRPCRRISYLIASTAPTA